MVNTPKNTGRKKIVFLSIGLSAGALLVLLVVGAGVYLLVKNKLLEKDKSSLEITATWEDLEEVVVGTDLTLSLKRAGSCEKLETLALEYQANLDKYYDSMRSSEFSQEEGSECEDCGDSGDGYMDDSFSLTNVQVEGIDEKDSVKTDGNYAYHANAYDGNIYIAKANPASGLSITSIIDSEYVDFTGLYLYKNYLVGIGHESYRGVGSAVPGWWGTAMLEIYDISNKSSPEMVKGWMFEGYESGSRLIDGELYLVMNTYRYYYYDGGELNVPEYKLYEDDVQPMCDCADVLIPEGARSNSFSQIVGIDLNDLTKGANIEVVYGFGDTIYMSKENLYISGTSYEYSGSGDAGFWQELGSLILPRSAPTERTVITKFDFGKGKVEYLSSGQVPGSLLNQFSLDEYDGNLRVAVTKNRWMGNQSNAVYVLDDELNRVGSITGLAEGESIYAARFIGPRGYLVTFERVDPLFVLDLENAGDPKLLGELKIPGYSDYLHPWGDGYLIGFGMETSDRGDWVETHGVKIALFDVNDPTDPKEVSKLEIGGSGSYSDILFNHRALLANQDKGWFAVPLYEYAKEGGVIEYGPGETPKWDVSEFQGLYVFTVDLSEGELALKGVVTHHEEDDFSDRHEDDLYDCGYYNWERDISRGLYINDWLYAVSYQYIGAYEVSTLKEISKIPFGIEVPDCEDYTSQ